VTVPVPRPPRKRKRAARATRGKEITARTDGDEGVLDGLLALELERLHIERRRRRRGAGLTALLHSRRWFVSWPLPLSPLRPHFLLSFSRRKPAPERGRRVGWLAIAAAALQLEIRGWWISGSVVKRGWWISGSVVKRGW
jgi:hypothetical protein